MRLRGILAAAICVCLSGAAAFAQQVSTILADADAYIEKESWEGTNSGKTTGGETSLRQGTYDWNRKIYMHFDLGSLNDSQSVTQAWLRIAWQSTPYDPGNTRIFAIMDEAKDWNLTALPENAICYDNAPQVDAATLPVPLPFLEEGSDTSSVTRLLGDVATPNSGIDLDVTGLVQWVLGQNSGFSTFADTDNILTIVMRETVDYSFTNYYSKEYTPGDDSDAPRLVITQESAVLPMLGDTNDDNCVDGADYTNWADNYKATGVAAWPDGRGQGNFNADDTVDGADYTLWADNYTGPCGQAVPEPVTLLLLAPGLGLALRQRR